ncbi:DJ-1/PfpI family protein [Lachnospiraceae bacterium MD1]|uniref:DJ-1/PfpI family protein n=1 Tax=Variimorphobacter saccharofermentans TaxID=2755051 RepID=A0A839JYZ5_9FIRM|nr:DJ-1/PfpI family protein [Variimorphobacter saccharofermentans]MBB2182202.1 DJ-1/PfpI family protein [Variimorphobacter saccharofermentans]
MDVNIFLFDGFETLDAFGPVEILGKIDDYTLKYYSINGGVIASAQGTQIITEKVEYTSKDGILVIPGGKGTRTLVNDSLFIQALKETIEISSYCLSICTGSALVAKTGLLDNKKATSNKKAFDWVVSINPNVNWVKMARWVVDGKYYTSSGVSAGMDMTLGFIKDRFSEQKAIDIAKHIEYIWNEDSRKDLFAI